MTPKPIKFQLMLSEDETERLDTYAAENQLKSRAEAIRRLCELGLQLDRESNSIREKLQRMVSSAHVTAKKIVGINTRLANANDDKQKVKIYEKAIVAISGGVFEAFEMAGNAMTSITAIVAMIDPGRATEGLNDALKSAKLLQSETEQVDEAQMRMILQGHQNIQDRLRRDDDT